MRSQIEQWVEQTPFIDTHEHFVEESQRLSGVFDGGQSCDDWTYWVREYVARDLVVAGMPRGELHSFLGPNLSCEAKYRLVAPYWDRIRHTGYAQAVRYTLRGIYDEHDLAADTVRRIAEKYRETIRPGFYADILKRANIENCQVNSLQRIFM